MDKRLQGLMWLVMRMQMDAQQLQAQLCKYDKWKHPQDGSAELCADLISYVQENLEYMRDELREEIPAQVTP